MSQWPPNEMAVAISALGLWLFVGLAAWGDNHRLWGVGKSEYRYYVK